MNHSSAFGSSSTFQIVVVVAQVTFCDLCVIELYLCKYDLLQITPLNCAGL